MSQNPQPSSGQQQEQQRNITIAARPTIPGTARKAAAAPVRPSIAHRPSAVAPAAPAPTRTSTTRPIGIGYPSPATGRRNPPPSARHGGPASGVNPSPGRYPYARPPSARRPPSAIATARAVGPASPSQAAPPPVPAYAPRSSAVTPKSGASTAQTRKRSEPFPRRTSAPAEEGDYAEYIGSLPPETLAAIATDLLLSGDYKQLGRLCYTNKAMLGVCGLSVPRELRDLAESVRDYLPSPLEQRLPTFLELAKASANLESNMMATLRTLLTPISEVSVDSIRELPSRIDPRLYDDQELRADLKRLRDLRRDSLESEFRRRKVFYVADLWHPDHFVFPGQEDTKECEAAVVGKIECTAEGGDFGEGGWNKVRGKPSFRSNTFRSDLSFRFDELMGDLLWAGWKERTKEDVDREQSKVDSIAEINPPGPSPYGTEYMSALDTLLRKPLHDYTEEDLQLLRKALVDDATFYGAMSTMREASNRMKEVEALDARGSKKRYYVLDYLSFTGRGVLEFPGYILASGLGDFTTLEKALSPYIDYAQTTPGHTVWLKQGVLEDALDILRKLGFVQ